MKPANHKTCNMKHETSEWLMLHASRYMMRASRCMILILLLSLVLSFAAAPMALADNPPPGETNAKTANENIAPELKDSWYGRAFFWGLNYVLTGIWLLEGKVINMMAELFDASFVYTMRNLREIDSINIGWGISRDVANMFFILILLGIAIATILRVQSYGAKALLPKLIVIALLINFSLSIGYIIIDFSNVLGTGFYTELLKAGKGQGISGVVFSNTKFSNTQNLSGSTSTTWPFLLGGGGIAAVACSLGGYVSWAGCIGAGLAGSAVIKVYEFIKSAGDFASAAQYFQWIAFPVIYGAVLIFVLLVGSLFLISRFIVLALALILAPLAFVFYILPDTEPYWKKWWGTLINQSFFLPAFLFLLYISSLTAGQLSKAVGSGQVQENTAFFMNLAINVMLLLASLIVARTMGIYFADTIIKTAHGARKWLTGAVGGVALRNVVAPIGERVAKTGVVGRIARVSPTAGTYVRSWVEGLRGAGGAKTQAEKMADLGLELPENRRGAYFAGLNTLGREAMLRKMDPVKREAFMKSLSAIDPDLEKAARGITASPLFTAKEKITTGLAELKGLSVPEQRNRFGGLTDEVATEFMHGMTPEQQAEFRAGLGVADQTRFDSLINSPRFTDVDRNKLEFAKFKRLPQPDQRARFGGLSAENKTELLAGKSAEQQAEFVDGLAGPDKTAAENLIKTSPRFTEEARQNFRIAGIMRKPKSDQIDAWTPDPATGRSLLSDNDKEVMLRKMKSDGDRAEFIDNLGAPAATPSRVLADNILNSRFTPQEQQGMKVAGILRRAEDEQRAEWITMNGDDREAMLRNMKDDETRARFIAGFTRAPSATILGKLTPAQKAAWNRPTADDAERLIQTRFSASEQKSYQKAASRQWTKDSKANLGDAFVDLKDSAGNVDVKKQDAVWDDATDYERAELAYALRSRGNDARANNLIAKLTAEGSDKFRKESARFITQKSVVEIEKVIDVLPKEEIEYMVRGGDEGKIAAILTTMKDRDKAKRVGAAAKDAGLDVKLRKYLNPIDKVEFIDQPPPAEFIEKVRVEIENTSPRDLAQRIKPEVVATDAFKNAFLGMPGIKGGGSLTQLVALIDTPAKADAIKKMLEAAAEVVGTGKSLNEVDKDELMNKFEIKFNNKELGRQIVELRERAQQTLSPTQKDFVRQIFG